MGETNTGARIRLRPHSGPGGEQSAESSHRVAAILIEGAAAVLQSEGLLAYVTPHWIRYQLYGCGARVARR